MIYWEAENTEEEIAMDMAAKIKDLAVELTSILSVVGTTDENNVSDFVFKKFMEMDYFKNHPENVKFVNTIDDPVGRK